jgi:hypothetical protein
VTNNEQSLFLYIFQAIKRLYVCVYKKLVGSVERTNGRKEQQQQQLISSYCVSTIIFVNKRDAVLSSGQNFSTESVPFSNETTPGKKTIIVIDSDWHGGVGG